MKRFLAGLLCSAMLCTEILSASVFAAQDTGFNNLDEQISIEEVADEIPVGGESVQIEEIEGIGDSEETLEIVDEAEVLSEESILNGEEATEDENIVGEEILGVNPDTLQRENGAIVSELGKASDGSECFTVSDNRLALKKPIDGASVVIPSYADANGDGIIQDNEILKIIPVGIFNGSTGVDNVSFPVNANVQLTTIEAGAFEGSSVKKLILPAPGYATELDGTKFKILKDASGKELYNGLTVIGEGTFRGSYLEELDASAATGLKTIEVEAFTRSHIKSFTAPDALKLIKSRAFMSCQELATVVLNNVEVIESEAFSSCTALGSKSGVVSVSFTDKIRTIGDSAFEGCGFYDIDMSKAYYLEDGYELDGVVYNDGKALGKRVFKNCQKLTSIKLPWVFDDIDGITEEMFSGCIKLASVTFTIPANGFSTISRFGEAIGVSAFANCSSLVSVVFPTSIYTIKSKAFVGCSKLKDIQIANRGIESTGIAEDAFPTNTTIITIKGVSRGLEEYCQEHSKIVKFQNIAQENKITFSVPNAKHEASVSKAKYGDEVTIKITPNSGYTLSPKKIGGDLIYAENKSGQVTIDLALVACDSTSQTFKFTMPYMPDKDDTLKVTASVLSTGTYKESEKTLTVTDTYMPGYTTLTQDRITTGRLSGGRIVFETRGEQLPLLFKDEENRYIGPWRFKFESTDTTVAKVTSDGVVTAGSNSNKKDAQILATLISTGKTVAIPVQVEKSVTIDKMDFQFSRYDSRIGQVVYELPSRVREAGTVIKYEEVIETIDGEKVTKKVPHEYKLIAVPRTKVKKGDVSFTCEVLPGSGDDDKSYVVDTKWSSRDTTIATVEKKSVDNNMNKITIKKNAVGETEIRVKATNSHLDKSDNKYEFEYGYIIRVEDDIPRLSEKTFTINTYKEKGYELKVVEGYKSGAGLNAKYEIFDHKLWVGKMSGTEMVDMTSDFIVTYDEDLKTYFIKETEKVRKAIAEGKSKKYTKLYLCGQVRDNSDIPNDGTFEIPLGTITVSKIALASDISLKGTINTFYDARYEDEDHSYSGKVTLYQSNWDETVKRYYLVTAEHHEEIQKGERSIEQFNTNPKDPLYDELRANFTFGYINETTGTVPVYRTRTESLAQDDAGEDVVSGYLYIKYEGYTDCLYKEITIPVKKTKPKYVLDITSGTASTLQKKQQYDVLLVSKDTKKLPIRDILNPDGTVKKDAKGVVQREYIDLLNESFVDNEGKTIAAKYWYDVDTDGDVFDKTKTEFTKKIPKYVDLNNKKKKEETKEYTSIPITVNNPDKAKAYIYVQLYNWAEPIKYTFTLKTTSKLATAKVKPSKVSLYTMAENTPAEFNVTLNQKFAKLIVDDVKEYGISVTFEQDKDKPYISVGKAEFERGAIAKGTYSFVTYGHIQYGDGDDDIVDLAKPIKFKVAVKETKPYIKLKNSTFKLNSNVAGVELLGTKFTLKSIPVGDNEYAIISENAITISPNGIVSGNAIENPVVKGAKITCLTKDPKTKEPYPGIADKVVLKLGKSEKDGDYDMLMVGLEEGFYQNRTYKFLVKGVQVTDKYNNIIDLKDFKIKITIKKSAISVSQKATGVINPIDPKTDTVYKPKFKNFGNIKVISANFIEQNKYGKATTETHFKLDTVSQNTLDEDKMPNIAVDKNNVVVDGQYMLTSNGNVLEKGKAYYGIIRYTYEKADGTLGKIDTKKFKISLKQSMPKVGLSFVRPKNADNVAMSTVMYSGSDRDQVCTVRVMPEAYTNAQFDKIEVFLPENPSVAQKNVKRAFEPKLFTVGAPKGFTARETRALRMEEKAYKVYALIDGEMVCLTKPVGTISVNDIDPTNTKQYACEVQGIDYDLISTLIEDPNERPFYEQAVTEIQADECKYYRSFSSNKSYEKKDGHYYVKVELLNAAAITKNTPTDVTFELKYKNQMKKTSGTKFNINVTLKK